MNRLNDVSLIVIGIIGLAGTATANQVLLSGSSTTPAWSTATYPATTTANGVLYSSATNTVAETTPVIDGVLISDHAAGVPSFLANGSAGQVLTAVSGAPPAWAAAAGGGFTSVVIQTFTADGTYTPTASMLYCIIEVVGGGGGSGGTAAASSTQVSVSSGGGGGEYARGVFSAATVGASKSVSVGTAGVAGAATPTAGGTGGTTSVGALITAVGGAGGTTGVANNRSGRTCALGGTGGTGGSVRVDGGTGPSGYAWYIAANSVGAYQTCGGGDSMYGAGGRQISNEGADAGGVGKGNGAGASGAGVTNGAAQAGAAGLVGLVVITEYI